MPETLLKAYSGVKQGHARLEEFLHFLHGFVHGVEVVFAFDDPPNQGNVVVLL